MKACIGSKVYKNKSVFSLHTPVVFKLFSYLVEENIKYKEFAFFYENTSYWSVFSSGHLPFNSRKIDLNIHVMGGLKNFKKSIRVPEQVLQ
jgi:hypothetical protein